MSLRSALESSLASFYKLFCAEAKQGFTCGQNSDATKVKCGGDACAGPLGGTESMLDIENARRSQKNLLGVF